MLTLYGTNTIRFVALFSKNGTLMHSTEMRPIS